MRLWSASTAVLLILAVPGAMAAPGDDPRIATIDYGQGGLFHLATSPETHQTVLFAPDEQIQSVVISDPGAYQISVAGSGDSLSLKPSGMSAIAILSVRTDQRSYELELVPNRAGSVPGIFRFSYAAPQAQTITAVPIEVSQTEGWKWSMSGDKALRPLSLQDDGDRTFIEWADDQAMPAVFAIGPSGKEEMVEGYVRDGVIMIDRVYTSLVFRIDKAKAGAKRVKDKRKKRDD